MAQLAGQGDGLPLVAESDQKKLLCLQWVQGQVTVARPQCVTVHSGGVLRLARRRTLLQMQLALVKGPFWDPDWPCPGWKPPEQEGSTCQVGRSKSQSPAGG